MKKNALLDEIIKEYCFGKVVGHVYTIEFQKRGLPHIHPLIFFTLEDKIKEPAHVDQIIRAEFPDKENEPHLFDIVARTMVHGPCGDRNPTASCMVNGKCTKRYPKLFQPATTMSEDGYPTYRR